MRNRKRKFLENLAVSGVKALNISGLPYSRTLLYARMWHWKGAPWTITALADASSIDRSTVRDHLRNFPPEHIVRTEQGVLLTPEGQRAAYRFTKKAYCSMPAKERRFIKTFFSTHYAGNYPFRRMSEFFVDLDRCNRHVTSSIAFRVILTTMDLASPKIKSWTISELATETAYSYQAVHKVLSQLVERDFVTKKNKQFSITKKGRITCVIYFFAAIRRADMRLLKILLQMTQFHFRSHNGQ